jgi:hypothetical protein
VTEREWLEGTDPQKMLQFLHGKASDRKLRLFACACCRRIWHLFLWEDSFKSIDVAERFADGEATAAELHVAKELAVLAGDDASWRSMEEAVRAWAAAAPTQKNGISAAQCALFEIQRVFTENETAREEERVSHIHLLRDIFGNPFRPVALDPALRTLTVTTLAQAIYTDRRFEAMPILADALEVAGCTDDEILAHCRGDGPHVLGCWLLDLILEKD